MNLTKLLWVVIAAISVCFAQTYNISGIVTDTGTMPLSGAVVRLEKAGLTATSGADGRFAITGTAGIRGSTVHLSSKSQTVTLRDGFLDVVRVQVYITERAGLQWSSG